MKDSSSGRLYAFSCDTRLDLDNSAALTPDGRLLLLLNKFTYQELQLSGMLSAHILRRPLEKFGKLLHFLVTKLFTCYMVTILLATL